MTIDELSTLSASDQELVEQFVKNVQAIHALEKQHQQFVKSSQAILDSIADDLPDARRTRQLKRRLSLITQIPQHDRPASASRVIRMSLVALLVFISVFSVAVFTFAAPVRSAVLSVLSNDTHNLVSPAIQNTVEDTNSFPAPSKLPTGYRLVICQTDETKGMAYLAYANGEGNVISYFYLAGGEVSAFDNEFSTGSMVEVNGRDAFLTVDERGYAVLYGLYGDSATYRIEGAIPEDAMMDLASSITQ